jgi:hypothetical protein
MSRFLRKSSEGQLPGLSLKDDEMTEYAADQQPSSPRASETAMPMMPPFGAGDGENAGQAVEESVDNPMIHLLNQEAKKKAQQFIRRSFQDPTDLDEVSALRTQLQKQAVVTSSQLKGAVQSKLEALKRAADLMDESSEKLDTLSNTMRTVNGRIAESNTAISKYPHLGRVHNVRDNVGKV